MIKIFFNIIQSQQRRTKIIFLKKLASSSSNWVEFEVASMQAEWKNFVG